GDEKVAGRWASSVTLTGSQKWRMVKVPFPNPSEGTVTVRITKQGNGEAYIDNVGLMPFYSDNPFDITLDTSDIVIKILDGNSQKAVPNCKITLNDREFISDTNGVVQLSGVISNQYSLLVEKEGYYDYSNDAVDIYSDSTIIIGLIAEHITGSIYVMDLSTGQPVYRAKITFNDSVITLSSSDGSTDFESQAGEKVSYKIEHDDYFTEEGMYMFYNDSSLVIAITPQFATVTFQITSDGEMVSASVHFNGYDYDARTGIASIYHPARQSYDYSIMKDGFDEIAGSVWLEKDTTITIELTVTHSAEKGHEGKLSVYPNPSNGRLFVEFPCIFINRYIKIVNLTGQIIHVQKADEMINEVDISNLDEAVYILRIVPLGLNRDIMFIKP
ncbi:MAG: T9SS type A sorting domain-containing protein, partial [Bacteroidales bacterium]|nr:T9SS type A sorting domain-containing protein [Bacteroidales bacterium]